MWTQPLGFGAAASGLGTLVLDVHFEDSPDTGSYVNSIYPTHGPATIDQYITGTGALSSTHAYDGTQSYHEQSKSLATSGTTDLTIGTADFQISLFLWFNDVTSGVFGQTLVMFDTGGTSPQIFLEPTTGYIGYYNNDGGGVAQITSTTTPTLHVWHEVRVRRAGGITTLYLDATTIGSFIDSTTYGSGTTLRIGSAGNTAAPLADAYIDNITFYNSNV